MECTGRIMDSFTDRKDIETLDRHRVVQILD